MNYLYEINHFYTWLTTHPLSPQGQALWHLLMSIDNKSGWPAQFTVSSSTLAAQLGVSRTQLSRCRKELKDAGRIFHIRQQGSQPPIYRLARRQGRRSLRGPAAPPEAFAGQQPASSEPGESASGPLTSPQIELWIYCG